jgi:arabinose-5-phosphate isomerase
MRSADSKPSSRHLRSVAKALSTDIDAARRVINYASAAMEALGDALNGDFSRAVDTILAIKGRVVVSGMGKSGLIGRKIAATLASTGTPALFIHPAEASHGDLGAVTRADALLMLSNSGDTLELSHLITFAKRFSIPLIGIASNADSTLLQAADVALLLPKSREACPMGLAPTTSTTLMLVLGDALAVALMERRGFTPDQYRELHPGGSLGKALIRVMDIMHRGEDIPLVPVDEPLKQAVVVLAGKRLGCVGAVDVNGSLVGIFTDGDLARHIKSGTLDGTIGDVMTRTPKIVGPNKLAAEAVATMNEKKITALFVVDPADKLRKPIGLLHMHDCLRAGIQ